MTPGRHAHTAGLRGGAAAVHQCLQHLLRRLAVAGQIQQQVDGAVRRKNGSGSWVQFQPAQQFLHGLAGHLPRVVQSLS
ncbi:MAG: hypothetical protein ACK559_06915, partial [bacterium]